MNQKITEHSFYTHKTSIQKDIRSGHTFRTLAFKQYNVILTKKQSLLMKIKSWFEGEYMKTQYNVFISLE